MRVKFDRICKVNAPLEILADSTVDWSHFVHLHRKSHFEFRLLHKEGRREIFLYKARMIYPLPFYRTFIAFREYLPEQNGYHQFYLHVRTGKIHYLNSSCAMEGDLSSCTGSFSFEISGFWRWIPGIFKRLFAFRMRAVQEEDNEWIKGRIEVGAFDRPACAPKIPASFHLMDEFLRVNQHEAELKLEDRLTSRL